MIALALSFALSLAVPDAPDAPARKTKSVRTPPVDVEPTHIDPAPMEPVPAPVDAPLPRLDRGARSVTFPTPVPVVGEVCTTRSTTTIRFEGDAGVLAAFGTERGGETVEERTILALRPDGKVAKMRYRVLREEGYVVAGGARLPVPRTREGSYVLTRADDEGRFDAVYEASGLPISEAHRYAIQAALDQRFPGVVDGRTLTRGEKITFSDEELRRYFPFEDAVGMKMKGHHMELGDIEDTLVRIDAKLAFEVNATQGEGDVTGWSTTRTDLAQRHVTTTMEGPLRLSLPGPVGSIGTRSAPDTVGDTPYLVKGTFHMTDQRDCVAPAQ